MYLSRLQTAVVCDTSRIGVHHTTSYTTPRRPAAFVEVDAEENSLSEGLFPMQAIHQSSMSSYAFLPTIIVIVRNLCSKRHQRCAHKHLKDQGQALSLV